MAGVSAATTASEWWNGPSQRAAIQLKIQLHKTRLVLWGHFWLHIWFGLFYYCEDEWVRGMAGNPGWEVDEIGEIHYLTSRIGNNPRIWYDRAWPRRKAGVYDNVSLADGTTYEWPQSCTNQA